MDVALGTLSEEMKEVYVCTSSHLLQRSGGVAFAQLCAGGASMTAASPCGASMALLFVAEHHWEQHAALAEMSPMASQK